MQRDVVASLASCLASGDFPVWLDGLPVGEVIGVAGNHDFWAVLVGTGAYPRLFGARWTYLMDASVERCGLTIYGTPWVPFLIGGWAFTAPSSHGGDFLAERFSAIPEDEPSTSCSRTHCPNGLRDVTQGGEQMGSRALLGAIRHRPPRLVVCGHVHEARGATGIGTYRQWTVVANCCMLGWDYQPNNRPPMQFLVPPRPQPIEVIAR
jgi:hypothetical protein